MPVLSNQVPDQILFRYCDRCYRLAELRIHTRSAYRMVRQGTVCNNIDPTILRRCTGLLRWTPRQMRRLMASHLRHLVAADLPNDTGRWRVYEQAENMEFGQLPGRPEDVSRLVVERQEQARQEREAIVERIPPDIYFRQYARAGRDPEGTMDANTIERGVGVMNRRHRRAASQGVQNPAAVNRPRDYEENEF